MSSYVLITAAHDEASFIERTCRSVLSQTVLPLRWIVVDDASTDATGAIVERYCDAHPERIELLRIERDPAGATPGSMPPLGELPKTTPPPTPKPPSK